MSRACHVMFLAASLPVAWESLYMLGYIRQKYLMSDRATEGKIFVA